MLVTRNAACDDTAGFRVGWNEWKEATTTTKKPWSDENSVSNDMENNLAKLILISCLTQNRNSFMSMENVEQCIHSIEAKHLKY